VHSPTVTEECRNLLLWASEVAEPWDVENLRGLRNGTAWGFSHDNSEITRERQEQWWREMSGRVGFGVLRRTEDGRWWTSVGVDGVWSGKGFGGAITADLLRKSPEQCWATARVDNVPAQRLHRASDWEELHRDEHLVYFRSRPQVHHA
jgi:hypothetical protein